MHLSEFHNISEVWQISKTGKESRYIAFKANN